MFVICISGIDGCGKTTQAKLLVKFLQEKGFDVQYAWLRWEPSLRRPFSFFRWALGKTKKKKYLVKKDLEKIRHTEWKSFKARVLSYHFIRHLWWTYACADYYFTSRKNIRKLDSTIVVVDRYIIDFIIDQSLNMRVNNVDTKKLLNNIFLRKFKLPDFSVIIDLPASKGYARKLDGTTLEYLKDREKRYKDIQSSKNTQHVNGLNEINIVAGEIVELVMKRLSKPL